jgi:hypothetical protein
MAKIQKVAVEIKPFLKIWIAPEKHNVMLAAYNQYSPLEKKRYIWLAFFLGGDWKCAFGVRRLTPFFNTKNKVI